MSRLESTNLRKLVFSYLSDDDVALHLLKLIEPCNELILFGAFL